MEHFADPRWADFVRGELANARERRLIDDVGLLVPRRIRRRQPLENHVVLTVAQGAYDLYQAFGGFAADDLVAKKKFEEKRAPQYFAALAQIYGSRPFATGEVPTASAPQDCCCWRHRGMRRWRRRLAWRAPVAWHHSQG